MKSNMHGKISNIEKKKDDELGVQVLVLVTIYEV